MTCVCIYSLRFQLPFVCYFLCLRLFCSSSLSLPRCLSIFVILIYLLKLLHIDPVSFFPATVTETPIKPNIKKTLNTYTYLPVLILCKHTQNNPNFQHIFFSYSHTDNIFGMQFKQCANTAQTTPQG